MRKLCPNCEELLKPTDNPEIGRCAGCGWIVPYQQAAKEPALPETPPKMPYVSIDIETTGLDPTTCQTLEMGAVIDDWKTPIDQLPRFRRVLKYDEVKGSPYAMALNAKLLKFIANAPKDPPQPMFHAIEKWVEQCAIDEPPNYTAVAALLEEGCRQVSWWDIPNQLLAGIVPEGLPPPIRYRLIDLVANPPGTSCFCQPDELAYQFHQWVKINGLDPLSLQAAGKNFASFDMQFLYQIPLFSQLVKFRHRVLDPAILFWHPLEDARLPDSNTCYERAGMNGKVAHTAVEDALAVVRLMRMGVKRLL